MSDTFHSFRFVRLLSTVFAATAAVALSAGFGDVRAGDPDTSVIMQDFVSPDIPGLSAPQADAVEFRGGGYVKNLNSACNSGGIDGPLYFSVRYYPPNLGANGSNTRFSFFFPLFYAENYVRESGDLGPNFKTVTGFGLSTLTFEYTSNPKIKIMNMTPSTITLDTQTVTMKGRVRGWANISDCRVDFEIGLSRRPV